MQHPGPRVPSGTHLASKANIDYLGPKNGTPPRVVVVGDGAVGAPAASVGEGKRKLGEVRDNLH